MVEQNMPRKTGTPINANSAASDEEVSENQDSESIGDENQEDEEMDEDYTPSEEFQDLDEQLNALSRALDIIERKNSNLQAELLELLQSSQETRKQLNDITNETRQFGDDS